MKIIDDFLPTNEWRGMLKTCEIILDLYKRPDTKGESLDDYSDNTHQTLDVPHQWKTPYPPYMTYSLEQIRECRDVLFKKGCWESFLKKACEEVEDITHEKVIPTDIRVCKVAEYDNKDIELNVRKHEEFGYMDNVPHVHLGENIVCSSVYYVQNPDKEYGTVIEDRTLIYGVENRCLFFDGSKIMHCGVWPPSEEVAKYPRYVIAMNFKRQ
jgi:hypothetical protein